MALNSPDLTRQLKRDKNFENEKFFIRNRNAIIAQVLGLVIVGALILIVGMTAGILTGVWNPIDVIIATFGTSKPVILVFSFLTIIFAQWSTNTAANLMPPAYILMNIFPKLNFKYSVIISGIIGTIILPWKFSAYLVQFQVISSGLLGPIVGIMIADYYFIRKRKLNVRDLYKENGEYKYKNNYNPAAVLGLIISFLVSLLLPNYSFFIGFILSIILYIIFMKTIVLKKYTQSLEKIIEYEE